MLLETSHFYIGVERREGFSDFYRTSKFPLAVTH